MNGATTQHGYLVIADISGYTSFVPGTELEHSHEILSDLLGIVCDKIEALLMIHKLEGDAVFAYAPEMKIQRVRDICEMIGSDVNLVHRLLKNRVSESTGWRAYMMFTEQCLDHMRLNLEDAYVQVESHEHFAEAKTYSLDLHKRYQETLEARRIFVDKDNADIVVVADFTVPPRLAWKWIQDPVKRNLWGHDVLWSSGNRPKGRKGSGASNHCTHGNGQVRIEVVLDWHPFEYSTTETFDGEKKLMTETFRFEPLPDGGTRVYDIMKIEMPLPCPIRRIMGNIFARTMKMEEMMQKAAHLAGEEYHRSKREEFHEVTP